MFRPLSEDQKRGRDAGARRLLRRKERILFRFRPNEERARGIKPEGGKPAPRQGAFPRLVRAFDENHGVLLPGDPRGERNGEAESRSRVLRIAAADFMKDSRLGGKAGPEGIRHPLMRSAAWARQTRPFGVPAGMPLAPLQFVNTKSQSRERFRADPCPVHFCPPSSAASASCAGGPTPKRPSQAPGKDRTKTEQKSQAASLTHPDPPSPDKPVFRTFRQC